MTLLQSLVLYKVAIDNFCFSFAAKLPHYKRVEMKMGLSERTSALIIEFFYK